MSVHACVQRDPQVPSHSVSSPSSTRRRRQSRQRLPRPPPRPSLRSARTSAEPRTRFPHLLPPARPPPCRQLAAPWLPLRTSQWSSPAEFSGDQEGRRDPRVHTCSKKGFCHLAPGHWAFIGSHGSLFIGVLCWCLVFPQRLRMEQPELSCDLSGVSHPPQLWTCPVSPVPQGAQLLPSV